MNIHSGFPLYIVSWQRKYFHSTQIIIFDNFNIFLGRSFYPVFNYTSLWCLLKGRTNFLYWLMKLISKQSFWISFSNIQASEKKQGWNIFSMRVVHLSVWPVLQLAISVNISMTFSSRRWSALDLEPLKISVHILEEGGIFSLIIKNQTSI